MTVRVLGARTVALVTSVALAHAALFAVGPSTVRAASPDLFISEYIEGSSFNKALEIYNGTGTDVDLGAGGYVLELYSNGSATASQSRALTGTIAAGDVYVLAHASASAPILAQADATDSGVINHNGDDAYVLRRGTAVVDSFGQVGTDPGSFWGTDPVTTADHTLVRKPSVQQGDPVVDDAFDPAVEWEAYPSNTTDRLGYHAVDGGEQPVTVNCGAALNVLQGASASRTITASDADGTVTTIEIDGITPTDPGTITLGPVTPANAQGGTASATLSVDSTTAVGSYTVSLMATNAEGETGACSLTVNVQQVLTVGEVQGPTEDREEGRADRSPFAPATGNGNGQTVAVRGVVTQRLRFVSGGGQNYGFFLQSTLAGADGDPQTSDGVFVFQGRFATLLREGGGSYFPEVGDQVVLRGPVVEYFNLTQLNNPRLVVEELNRGIDLATQIETADAQPPDVLADAHRWWERHEGMQLSIAAGANVVAGRDVFASTADGEVWVIRGDHALAQRADPYAQRVFRDVHPLDDVGPAGTFDNGNGMRILLVSHGLKWNASSNAAMIAPARTFDTVNNALSGGVYYSFNKYGVEIQQQLDLTPGADPSLNAPPPAPDREVEYSTAIYNVENLYDYRDDPFDGCDFPGNAGCPGVRPPFDYVPVSQADYDAHLAALADQIANDLYGPDIILVQEAEDQDVCAVIGGAMDCDDGVDDRDGKPDTLQELTLLLATVHGLPYDAAYDRDGADDRGIVSAFLYRTDRVELLEADPEDPVLGSSPDVEYAGAPLDYATDVQNPKALNARLPDGVALGDGCDEQADGRCVFTRDPQVGLFRVWRDGIGTSAFTDVYAISNHFSSGPDSRVPQRTEQARYDAAIVDALRRADPDQRVVVGGDFNVFPRPDDPFAPGHPQFRSDQLAALYELGLQDLWAVVAAQAPSSAYSYVFEGQAQTLDNQFTTEQLFEELTGVRYAHINADWPAAHDGDGSRGASDHDPQVARFGAITTDALVNLVEHLLDGGAIDPSRAAQLLSRLERVEEHVDVGDVATARDQLEAFGNQVDGLSPRWMDPAAAEMLQMEADILAENL